MSKFDWRNMSEDEIYEAMDATTEREMKGKRDVKIKNAQKKPTAKKKSTHIGMNKRSVSGNAPKTENAE